MGAKKNNESTGAEELAARLKAKAHWARVETLKIHKIAPETRIASSLSNVEILTALYYGGTLRFNPKEAFWPKRDRFVISKGHGSIAMYPILADVGYFSKDELSKVCTEGSFLGGIPDPIVPGYETINGSLGHGLGVACGMAVGLAQNKSEAQVFVLAGDGEWNEGSMWEAVMFAAHHKLDNLNVIVDVNKKCMLGLTEKILDLNPLADKFRAFGFQTETVDGHDVVALHEKLSHFRGLHEGKPKILLAETIKGKGSPKLEATMLCHITALNAAEVDATIAGLKP